MTKPTRMCINFEYIGFQRNDGCKNKIRNILLFTDIISIFSNGLKQSTVSKTN